MPEGSASRTSILSEPAFFTAMISYPAHACRVRTRARVKFLGPCAESGWTLLQRSPLYNLPHPVFLARRTVTWPCRLIGTFSSKLYGIATVPKVSITVARSPSTAIREPARVRRMSR